MVPFEIARDLGIPDQLREVNRSSFAGGGRILAFLTVTLLLRACEDEPRGAPVDETPAAIEAPALAPKSLVEDPPDAPPVAE